MTTTTAYTTLPATPATAALRDRHRDYYVSLAETATLFGPDAPRWRDVIRDEAANLRTALAWAMKTDPVAALRIFGAVGGSGWYVHRWDPVVVADLEAAVEHAAPDVAFRFYVAAASWFGDLVRAEHHANHAVDIACASGSVSLEASALKTRGSILITMDGFMSAPGSQAIADLSRALELARGTGDRRLEAEALHWLGQPDVALGIFRELGDDFWVAWSAWSASMARSRMGDLAAARTLAAEAVTAARASGEPWTEQNALTGAGGIEKLSGDNERARSLCLDALAVARRSAMEGAAAPACLRLAVIAGEAGDTGDAVRWLKEALRAAATVPNVGQEMIQAVEWLAFAASLSGEFATAARLFGATVGLARSTGQPTVDTWKDVSTARAYSGPTDQFFTERERTKQQLGAEEYERLAGEGEALSRDQIVREALAV